VFLSRCKAPLTLCCVVYLGGDRFRLISKKVLDQPQASLKTRSYDNLFTVDRGVEVEIAVDSQPEHSTGPN